MPILEYHGITLGQSIAIARFLAKKTGMYGKDDEQQAMVDAIVDYVTDYNNSKQEKKLVRLQCNKTLSLDSCFRMGGSVQSQHLRGKIRVDRKYFCQLSSNVLPKFTQPASKGRWKVFCWG